MRRMCYFAEKGERLLNLRLCMTHLYNLCSALLSPVLESRVCARDAELEARHASALLVTRFG